MNVVMVSAEAGPLAKTGGLADAVWSLSKSLRNHVRIVTVVLPRYPWIEVSPNARKEIRGTTKGLNPTPFTILEDEIDGVRVAFVDSPLFAKRAGIYGPDPNSEYQDNVLRFTILGEAAVEIARRTSGETVLHGHDWPAGIALAIAAATAPDLGRVITIHNAAYAGIFSKHDLHYTGLPADSFGTPTTELRNSRTISLLRAGVAASDRITTVSEGYASEIARDHSDLVGGKHMTGIVNGVDYEVWNPESDASLPEIYSADRFEGKRVCKRALQRASGLNVSEDAPLIGFIGRLVDQKGLEELCFPRGGAISRIASSGTQLVLLGTGSARYESALRSLDQRHQNVSAHIGFDEDRAHLIEAGADLFLMPSRFEPCGLNQLYSLRYGTPPVVHETGGLADTVIDAKDRTGGTGFTYRSQRPRTIAKTARSAVRMWRRKPDEFYRMVCRGMALDFSWNRAADRYCEVYDEALTASKARTGRSS